MKVLYLDLETTGLDPVENGVIQLAAILEIDGLVEGEFDSRIRPFESDKVTSEALVVTGTKRKDLEGFPAANDVHKTFKAWLEKYVDRYDKGDKLQLIGYNVTFDDRFLREWFRKCGDSYYGSLFWWPPVDVAVLAADYFLPRRAEFPRFTLVAVAAFAGVVVSEGEAHDALYDVKLTRELYWNIGGQARPKAIKGGGQ